MTKRKIKAAVGEIKRLLGQDDMFIREGMRGYLQDVLEAEKKQALGAVKSEHTDTRRREGVPVGHVAARPPVAVTELTIPAAGGPRARKERVARLEIRTAEVELVPPCCARGADPLHWLLLTTERPAAGEATAVHAATVLDWYRRRWTIETWFRTLKTETRIKDRRLDEADDLRKCLAFDAVTAVHVADLTVLAR